MDRVEAIRELRAREPNARDLGQRTQRAEKAAAEAPTEPLSLDVASTLSTLSFAHGDLGARTLAPEPDFGDEDITLHAGPTRYEAVAMLGAGGMGRVDQVWDQDLMRSLALKRLHPEHAGDKLALRQFLWEARVTAHLDHPNIVPVHDLGLDKQGELYFTMKFVQGQSLEELIDALARADHAELHGLELDPADAAVVASHGSVNRRVRLFLDLCQAIAYAHERGIVHRDLKPANIMTGRFGEVLIMDWGLALPLPGEAGEPLRALLPEALRRRNTRPTSGTPRYMAPEQVNGGELDARSDVYALGVVLYELLALCSPYTATELTALLLQVSDGEAVPLRDSAPEISSSLAAIVARAMAPDLERRYASVQALMDDVAAFLDGLTPKAEQASLALRFHRYYLEEHNPHAAHLRPVDLDLALATGVFLGLFLATLIGTWLLELGLLATILLAAVAVLIGYTPTRAVFRAVRSGKQRLEQLRTEAGGRRF